MISYCWKGDCEVLDKLYGFCSDKLSCLASFHRPRPPPEKKREKEKEKRTHTLTHTILCDF